MYEQVEEKEAWCDDVKPAVEIGVFTAEEFVGASNDNLPKSLQGAVRMLQECAFQFDVVDTQSDFAKYRLRILPDQIPVDPLFADKLSIYMENGGKAIFTCKSGLTPDEASFALDIGVTKREEQPVDVYGEDVVGKIYDR